MDERREKKMFGLNYAQVVMGVLISFGTIMGVFASYITLPAKVEAVQTSQKEIWDHISKTDDKRAEDHDLMLRMDERLKQIQQSMAEKKLVAVGAGGQ